MEDQDTNSLLFKISKVARYTALFGPSRTLAKIKGQYHLKRTETFAGERWDNPGCTTPESDTRFVGIIGCGNFPFSNIAYYLAKENGGFLRGAYDINLARSRSLVSTYGGAYAAATPEIMLADDRIKLLYIASNHASHAEYAIAGLDAGKHVHIEKPHVVSEDQLRRLNEARMRNPQCMIFLGFNRPRSKIFRRIKSILAAQSGPMMINWFVAGHHIPEGHWYYDAAEGGRILGNLSHWTDLTLHMVGLDNLFPCEIRSASAPDAKSDFAVTIVFGDKSIAGITFSAKGYTFEGVREMLNVHKGDAIISLRDFNELRADIGPKRVRYKGFFRNHGHKDNILNSYLSVRDNDVSRAVTGEYSDATARLVMAVRTAVESRAPVVLDTKGVVEPLVLASA